MNSADDFFRKLLAADVDTVTLDKSTEVEEKVEGERKELWWKIEKKVCGDFI